MPIILDTPTAMWLYPEKSVYICMRYSTEATIRVVPLWKKQWLNTESV